MNFEYIIALVLLSLFYVISIYLMKYIRHFQLANIVFGLLVFIVYICHCTIIYKCVGFNDWNFQNTLPVANVSPFMFSLMPIIMILPQKIKKHLHLLISLLFVAMFLASVLGCISNAVINYKFHFHFMLDYIAHIILSLYGIFLIRSKQVELTKKNCIISSSIILGSATVMLILNLIFDTSFFGLSLRGKHNIYNNVLTDNSYISALLYYLGAMFMLFLGFLACRFFAKERFAITQKTEK